MEQSAQRQRALNILISESEEIYSLLIQRLGGSEAFDASRVPEYRRDTVAAAALTIVLNIDKIDDLLRDVALDGMPQPIANYAINFYRNTLRPHRDALSTLALELINLSKTELDFDDVEAAQGKAARHQPLWRIFLSGVKFWEGEEAAGESAIDQEAIEDARCLSEANFFRPDEWLSRAEELEPVLGDSADARIPGHVRNRVREIYRSYIFGNYLSVIALARATLEYTLIDRGRELGMDPSAHDPQRPNRKMRLSALVEGTSERIPHLKAPMEIVVDAGNQTLHQHKRDKLTLLPAATQNLALRTLRAVQQVVEELYLHR